MTRSISIAIIAAVAGSASAALMNGRYEGAWNNLSFGSTGAATLDVSIVAGVGDFTMNLDGFVFGVADPPPQSFTVPVNPDGSIDPVMTGPDPDFGGATGLFQFDGTNFTSTLEGVFGGGANFGFDLVTVSGTVIGSEIRSTYEIYIFDTDTSPFARGTLNMDFVPAPGVLGLLAGAGLVGVCRRR